MTYQELIDALASASEKQPSDPVKFIGSDGLEKQIVSIDHVADVQGLFPTSEPNVGPYFKIQLGA